jgi:hypothetical protein
MKKSWFVLLVPALIAVMAGVFVLSLFLVKILWAWTVPDLFPGAVEKGLIAREISWFTSLKVAILAAMLAGIAGASKSSKK